MLNSSTAINDSSPAPSQLFVVASFKEIANKVLGMSGLTVTQPLPGLQLD